MHQRVLTKLHYFSFNYRDVNLSNCFLHIICIQKNLRVLIIKLMEMKFVKHIIDIRSCYTYI